MKAVGIIITNDVGPFMANYGHIFVISARPRKSRSPFVVLTAVLHRAIERSQSGLVIITHLSELMAELGPLAGMATRVLTLHAAVQHIDTVEKTMEQLRIHRATQYPPALLPSTRNLCGHAKLARVLFVGDQINPVYRSFRHWPFHANTGCTVYLARCLERIQFNELRGMWTNINSDEQHLPGLLEWRQRRFSLKPPLQIIALGKEASTGLAKKHIKADFELPHPQYASRFLSRKLDYAAALKSCIENALRYSRERESSEFIKHVFQLD